MVTKRPYPIERRLSCSVLVSLLIALSTWTSAWPQGHRPDATSAPPRPLDARIQVAVREGQLSVDLREAQVRDVLAAIGQQAGLRVHVAAAANRMVNAQFTDMELDQGLRRLLRAASLSYALLYARGPAATVILQEVRVFGEARGGAPASHDRPTVELAQPAATLPTSPLMEKRAVPEPATPEQEVDASQD